MRRTNTEKIAYIRFQLTSSRQIWTFYVSGHSAGVNLSMAVQQTIEAYSSVNKFLSAFIDHSLREHEYFVKNKLLFEKILNVELGEILEEKTVLYNDDSRSFTNVFFFGHEWILLLWDVLFFAIVDYIALNFVLAGILTYFQSRVLKSIRMVMGKKNLARKTLIDERFLIWSNKPRGDTYICKHHGVFIIEKMT